MGLSFPRAPSQFDASSTFGKTLCPANTLVSTDVKNTQNQSDRYTAMYEAHTHIYVFYSTNLSCPLLSLSRNSNLSCRRMIWAAETETKKRLSFNSHIMSEKKKSVAFPSHHEEYMQHAGNLARWLKIYRVR